MTRPPGDSPGLDPVVLCSPVPLRRELHRTDQFESGVPELDRWIARSAWQSERRAATRTYVTADSDGRVHGFVALVVGHVEHGEVTAEVARRMSPHFPIPAVLIARLAVGSSFQGRGVGLELLHFALERCLAAGQEVGIRAVVVDAIDERAAAFYRHFGFIAVPGAPLRLMVTIPELAAGFAD